MRNFTVHNVRLGLATNSSSTHSLIYIDPRKPPPSDEDVDGEQFGWSHFTAASKRAKLGYVAQTLKNNLGMLTPEFADAVIRSWVGDYEENGYIDHQSSMTLPASWNGKGIDKQFFSEFKHFMTRDDVAVLGGNDNDDESHPLASNTFDVGLPLDGNGQSENLVARKDVRGGFWTLFNRLDGTKIRMSFDAPEKAVKPRKAEVCELLDLAITSKCYSKCTYCYQDSKPDGVHADKDLLRSIAYACGEARVFEVAIGGGEPTLHPDFIEILRAFRSAGVVPNFTTRNLAWMRDPEKRTAILAAAGAFAFSVDKVDDVLRLVSAMTEAGIDKNRANVQYVVGASYDFEDVLDACRLAGLRVTMLGWKTTGRGDKVKPAISSASAFTIFAKRKSEHKLPRLCIDTVLAAQWEKSMASVGVNERLYNTDEGAFSMYIDAVAMKAGPSSYCKPELMRDFGITRNHFTADRLKAIFAEIQPVRGDV